MKVSNLYLNPVNPKLKPFVIEFTDSQIALMKLKAAARSHGSRQAGIFNRRVDQKRSDQQIDYDGVQSEVAFCMMLGYSFLQALNLIDKNRLDGTKDFDYHGFQISVKSTSVERGHLFFPPHQDLLKDHYAFLVWNQNARIARVLGWIKGDSFHQLKFLKDFHQGLGLQDCVSQNELNPNKDFFKIVIDSISHRKINSKLAAAKSTEVTR